MAERSRGPLPFSYSDQVTARIDSSDRFSEQLKRILFLLKSLELDLSRVALAVAFGAVLLFGMWLKAVLFRGACVLFFFGILVLFSLLLGDLPASSGAADGETGRFITDILSRYVFKLDKPLGFALVGAFILSLFSLVILACGVICRILRKWPLTRWCVVASLILALSIIFLVGLINCCLVGWICS